MKHIRLFLVGLSLVGMAFNASAQEQSTSDTSSESSASTSKKRPESGERGEFRRRPFGPHAPGGSLDHDARPLPPEVVEKYDLDKDGRLRRDEIRQAREEMKDTQKDELLKKYDKNGDGKLSDTEKDRLEADRLKMMREELIKEYDKNGNGKLDSIEKEQIKTDAKLQPGRFPWLSDPRPHPLKELVK